MKELLKDIEFNTEYLQTSEGDEHECITIENLKGLLKKYNISLKKEQLIQLEEINKLKKELKKS